MHQARPLAVSAHRALRTSPAHHCDAISTPPLDGAPKQHSAEIRSLADKIAGLTIVQVAELNELLKVGVVVERLETHISSHQID